MAASGAFYVTTPIYYVNDAPHIGHAYTTLACDALATQGQPRASPCIALSRGDATVALQIVFPAQLDFTQEDVQRGVLLGRAALAPLGAQLAFGQGPSAGSHIKLVLPMNSHDNPP